MKRIVTEQEELSSCLGGKQKDLLNGLDWEDGDRD